jgi:hypothetical protein
MVVMRDNSVDPADPKMALASTSDVERAKRVYGDLVRTVLDLAKECPESRHVAALATIVDAFHDDILKPLECGRRADAQP